MTTKEKLLKLAACMEECGMSFEIGYKRKRLELYIGAECFYFSEDADHIDIRQLANEIKEGGE